MTYLDTTTPQLIKAPKWNGHVHVLYAIGTGPEGPMKIGQTSDVSRRIRSLQTGSPIPLMVFALYLIMPKIVPNGARVDVLTIAKRSATKLERYIHGEMSGIGLRMMGEWVDVSADEAAEIIEKLSPRADCRAMSVEWLSSHAAKIDPEYGFLQDRLLAMSVNARAQANAINDYGLTFIQKCGHISKSAGS